MLLIEHSNPNLEYDDVVNKARLEFGLPTIELELFDSTSNCAIPPNLFEVYCRKIQESGILQIRINKVNELENILFENNEFLAEGENNNNLGSVVIYQTDATTTQAHSYSVNSKEDIVNILLEHCPTISSKINKNIGLTTKERNDLSVLIIKTIINRDPNKLLIREDFTRISRHIKDIFPKEVEETYFIPSTRGSIAKGKLFNIFNNYRAELSRNGIIKRRSRSSTTSSTASSNSEITNLDLIDSDLTNDIDYLKSHIDDGKELIECWTKTFSYRSNLLSTSLPTFEYFELFPVLKTQSISKLMQIDAKLRHSNIGKSKNWQTVYLKIIEKTQFTRDAYVKYLHKRIEKSEYDEQIALALVLLPYILPHHGKRGQGKGRLSKKEIQDSFISLYKTSVEAAETETNNDFPKIIFIGDPIEVIQVQVAGEIYSFKNILEALDTCFNIFIGVNIKYPPTCEHVWLFIQKAIYNVVTEHDRVNPAVTTLINDITSKE